MTIDIEKLIEKIDTDGSGEIEFDEFKALLNSNQEDVEAWKNQREQRKNKEYAQLNRLLNSILGFTDLNY